MYLNALDFITHPKYRMLNFVLQTLKALGSYHREYNDVGTAINTYARAVMRKTNVTVPDYVKDDLQIAIVVGYLDLPQGSGFNGDWGISFTRQNVVFNSSFDPMNENGYYEPTVTFKILVPHNEFLEAIETGNCPAFKLMCTGEHYYFDKHMLRDYIEDMFAYAWMYYSDSLKEKN